MAATIKGINVVIGAETTGLQKALSDVNKKSRDIQSELRKVDRLLKFDPKNTELVAQKQQLLKEAVATTKEKLDRLKEAQSQVNEQFKKGEIGEEQYRAFQREIAKTEQDLKKFEKQLEETGMTAEQLGGKLQDAGKKMTDAGKNLSMKITAPIAAAGAASFKMAADLEDAVGATEQIYKDAADAVKIWADNLESYYGIAESEALEYANMMGSMLVNIGGLTEEQAAKQAQTLIELAGDLTAMYGGSTQDAVRALTGALKGNNTMLDNYGMAVNDAMVKTKAYEMGLYSGKGEMDLTTKQAATLALIMEQTGAAQGQAAREAEGASGSMRAFTTGIKNLTTDIGENLLPIITPFIQKLVGIVGAFGELSTGTQKVIIAIAGIAAAIGPVLVVAGMLAQGIGALIAAFGGLAAGPILAVIAAVVALGAGLVALWKNNEQFREGVISAFEKIKAVALPIIEMFKESLRNAAESLKPVWENLVQVFSELQPVLKAIGAVVGTVLVVALGVVTGVINGVIKAIAPLMKAFTGLLQIVVNVVGVIVSLITGDFAGAFEHLKRAGQGLIEFISGMVQAVIGFVKGLVEGVVKFFVGLYDTLVGHSIIPDLVNGIITWFKELPGKLFSIIKDMMQKVISGIKDRVTAVKNAVDKIKTSITTPINSAISSIKSWIGSGVSWMVSKFNGFRTTVSGIFNRVKSAITGPISSAISTIKSWLGNLRLPAIKIPKIKLPHLRVTGGFSITPPRVPKFSVSWYDKGGIFKNPAIIGVGEKRPEFVGALDDLRYLIRDELQKNQPVTAAATGNSVVHLHIGTLVADDMGLKKLENTLRKFRISEDQRRGG